MNHCLFKTPCLFYLVSPHGIRRDVGKQVDWDSGVGFFNFAPCRSSSTGCDEMIRVADSKFLGDSLLPVCAIHPEPPLTTWFSTYCSQFIGCPFASSEHTLNQLEVLRWSQVWCKSVCVCVLCKSLCVCVCSWVGVQAERSCHPRKTCSPADRVGCSASLGVLSARCVFKVVKSTNICPGVLPSPFRLLFWVQLSPPLYPLSESLTGEERVFCLSSNITCTDGVKKNKECLHFAVFSDTEISFRAANRAVASVTNYPLKAT